MGIICLLQDGTVSTVNDSFEDATGRRISASVLLISSSTLIKLAHLRVNAGPFAS